MCIVRKSISGRKRSIHLANLGLIVFIASYCADKLNLGKETQSGMVFIVKFCSKEKKICLPVEDYTPTRRYKSAYDSNDDRST